MLLVATIMTIAFVNIHLISKYNINNCMI